ncbi:hypothetical protein [Nostoc sp.]
MILESTPVKIIAIAFGSGDEYIIDGNRQERSHYIPMIIIN